MRVVLIIMFRVFLELMISEVRLSLVMFFMLWCLRCRRWLLVSMRLMLSIVLCMMLYLV